MLTWNVNQEDAPLSVQAPADSRVWSVEGNWQAVQAEVLRLQPDLVSLQECAGEAAAPRLVEKYTVLGARVGHAAKAGYVQLYANKPLGATPLSLSDLPGVACSVKLRHTTVAVVALHLVAGEGHAEKRETQLRRAVAFAKAQSDIVVIFGDLNLRGAELAELTQRRELGFLGRGLRASQRLPLLEAAYQGFSWHPQANRYSGEEG